MIPPPPRRRLSSDLHTISSVQSETSGAGEVVCKKETFPLFGDEIVGAKCEPREGFQNKVQELLRDFDEYCRPSLQKNYSCPFSGRPRSQTEDGPYGFARKQRSEGGYREDGKSRLRGFLLKELVAEATLEDEPGDMTKIQNTVCASDNSEGTSFSTSATIPSPDVASEREALMGPASRCSSTSLSPPLLTPESTLIILDWDDTLFPTTWLQSKKAFKNCSKAWQDEQPDVQLSADDLAALEEMDQTARALVLTAADLGEVCCVTLAQRPWQEVSMKVFMPKLYEVWKELGIPVHYASEEADNTRLGTSGPAVRAIVKDPTELKCLLERQQVAKKMKAMEKVINRFYGPMWRNLISIGDGEAEWDAVHELVFNHANPASDRPEDELHLKTVKLLEEPTCSLLQAQLQVIHAWLPFIVSRAEDLNTRLPENEEEILALHEDFMLE